MGGLAARRRLRDPGRIDRANTNLLPEPRNKGKIGDLTSWVYAFILRTQRSNRAIAATIETNG